MDSKTEWERERSFEPQFFGAACLSEDGTITIPADALRACGIAPGDRLLVLGAPDGKRIWLGRLQDVRRFHQDMAAWLKDLESDPKSV